ncbi:MAG: GNAT family N-acetyltransferase, partial [Candidatus Omnitrophica bacterium]|nr:GNAT family N-acetyltransferase [Candidatus Omnitrophota bacterium]
WAEVLKETFHFKEISLMGLSDQGEVKAVLPLWQVKKGEVINSPWRDRADLLAENQKSKECILGYLREINSNVLLKDWNHEAPSDDFFVDDYWITSVLDLAPGKDVIWRNLDKSVHRNVAKAESYKIDVRQGSTLENMASFYRLFKKTRKRLGVPIFPWSFFKNILNHLNGSMRIYLGYFGGKPIGSIIVFDSQQTAIYAYGAHDHKYQFTRVNDKLFWQAIEDSITLGKSSFDFGADSPLQESLMRFKKKWGTFQKSLHTVYRNNKKIDFTEEDFSSMKYSVHRKFLRCMPIWVLTLLGSIYMRRRG